MNVGAFFFFNEMSARFKGWVLHDRRVGWVDPKISDFLKLLLGVHFAEWGKSCRILVIQWPLDNSTNSVASQNVELARVVELARGKEEDK